MIDNVDRTADCFDRLVGEYLRPVMIAHRFKASRGGKTFDEAAANGHTVLMQPKRYGSNSFMIDRAAIPPVLRDYHREQWATTRPTLDWGLIRARLVAPVELRLIPETQTLYRSRFPAV